MSTAAPTGAVEMMASELHATVKAGNELAEAAHRVQADYDGIHRLRLALAEWYRVRACEFGRPHA